MPRTVDLSFRMDLLEETMKLANQPAEKFDELMRAEKALLDRWHEAANAAGKGTQVNKLVSFPVADGRALYVVGKVGKRTCTLIHLPFGDGYCSPAVIQGSTHLIGAGVGSCPRSTVDRYIRAEEGMTELFRGQDAENDRFFDSLQVGQTVHVMRTGWIRCMVVVDEYLWGGLKKRGKCLKPIACVGWIKHKIGDKWVGDWWQHDLCNVTPTGEIIYGYEAKKVKNGVPFRCHRRDVFESHHGLRPGEPDPSHLPVLALEPPVFTPEEITSQEQWRQVKLIHELLNEVDRKVSEHKPLEVLRRVHAMAEAAISKYT